MNAKNYPIYPLEPISDLPVVIRPIELENPFIQRPHPHRHEFYEIILVECGKGRHVIDFNECRLEPDTVFFLSPGQVHMLEVQECIKGIYIEFKEEFVQLLFKETDFLSQFSYFHNFGGKPSMKIGEFPRIKDLFRTLLSEFQNKKIGQHHVLHSYFCVLLFELERLYRDCPTCYKKIPQHNLVYRFKKLLDKKYKTYREVKAFAKCLGVTPDYLSQMIKAATGKPVSYWIQERVALEAKRMLLNENFNVTEIAYDLQFDDPSYFSKYFKKTTGLTPKEFREKNFAL